MCHVGIRIIIISIHVVIIESRQSVRCAVSRRRQCSMSSNSLLFPWMVVVLVVSRTKRRVVSIVPTRIGGGSMFCFLVLWWTRIMLRSCDVFLRWSSWLFGTCRVFRFVLIIVEGMVFGGCSFSTTRMWMQIDSFVFLGWSREIGIVVEYHYGITVEESRVRIIIIVGHDWIDPTIVTVIILTLVVLT